MKDPKLYLAVDNCFACKRWVKPLDWMLLVRDMGLTLVEQSADTECDPLYMGDAYMREWGDLVRKASEQTGVYVKNVYSGHGTYSTCGLTHWHDVVRLRFREQWMKPQANTAKALGAGFGFFAHGFQHSDLQSAEVYRSRLNTLYDDLAELAVYGLQIGLSYIGLEQMYAPHMPPWTIEGTKTLLHEVYAWAGAPMYITIDLGHMNGQQFFQKPTEVLILEALKSSDYAPWLGTEHAVDRFRAAQAGTIDSATAVDAILRDAEANPHLFAVPKDGNIWQWGEQLGRYSPIIHLQQSDGRSSPHCPFTERFNQRGIASGEALITSLARVFDGSHDANMPPAVDEIVLTLEPFVGTAADPYQAVDEIAESVDYWRTFVPRDGMRLTEAMENL